MAYGSLPTWFPSINSRQAECLIMTPRGWQENAVRGQAFVFNKTVFFSHNHRHVITIFSRVRPHHDTPGLVETMVQASGRRLRENRFLVISIDVSLLFFPGCALMGTRHDLLELPETRSIASLSNDDLFAGKFYFACIQ